MRRHGWVLVVLVGALTWANSLGNGFEYDDFHSIVDNLNLRRPAQGEPWASVLADYFTNPATFSVDADKGMYRPLLVTSFAVNHDLGGYDVEGYHLVNIAVHVGCAVLVWWLAGLLGGGAVVRLVAGLLFAVDPVCSEPVNYISSRSESLSAAFYLLGLCGFLRAEAGPTWWRGVTWLALAAGLLTKSTTITLPAALLVLDAAVVLRGDWRRLLSRRLLTHHVPGGLVAAGYLVVVSANGWLLRSLDQEVRTPLAQWLTQAKAVPWYLHLLAVPTRLSVEPQFQEQTAWATVVVVAVLLALSLLGIGLWMLRQHCWRGLFLLIWPVLHLLPTLVVPLNVLVNERRAYMPAAAACLGVAWLLGPQLARARARGLALATVGLLAVLSWQRSEVWADQMSLWQDAARKAPHMARPFLYLGNVHKDVAMRSTDAVTARRHWSAASAAYERALTEARDDDLALRALNNRGGVLLALAGGDDTASAHQDRRRAEALFREAVSRNPSFADALLNLGVCILYRARLSSDPGQRQRLMSEAVDTFRRGLELRPNNYQGQGNLGVAYEDLGRIDEAEAAYRRTLFLMPSDFTTLKNLANLLYRRATEEIGAGRPEAARPLLLDARALASRSLQLNPATAGAQEVLQLVEQRLASLGGG